MCARVRVCVCVCVCVRERERDIYIVHVWRDLIACADACRLEEEGCVCVCA